MEKTRRKLRLIKRLMPLLSLGLVVCAGILTLTDQSTHLPAASFFFTGNKAKHIRYTGQDSKGQPFVLTAPQTRELHGQDLELYKPLVEITLDTGDKVTITGEKAIFNNVTKNLDVTGNVSASHTKGYLIQTPVAHVQFSTVATGAHS
jgi:hypothetical protein